MSSTARTSPSAPALDECDLIMKGGITSGVVYPTAVCTLAARYRIRRIGGSSAGAIGAVLTAAAEYRRATSPDWDDAGFEALNEVPRLLTDGDTLFQLFRPSPSTRGIFGFLLTLLDKARGRTVRALTAAGILIRSTLPVFLAVLVAALLPGLLVGRWLAGPGRWGQVWLSLLVWLPGALLLALAVGAVLATLRAVRAIDANGFGLAKGHAAADEVAPDAVPPLTDWLTARINVVAGRAPDDPPLTYGDLWGARATAWYLDRTIANDGAPRLTDLQRFDPEFDPDIDLLTMTTCLTLGLPYVFPFQSDLFHYCPSCMAEYFPDSVTKHLDSHSRPAGPFEHDDRRLGTDCPRHPGVAVRRLPHVPDLPIVLAARLSLSFPVLISAVPLYYLDLDKTPERQGLVTAWFSDGGITSNFPMHFFDAPLPSRPTFGINLASTDARYPGNDVAMSPQGSSRLPRETELTSLVGFLRSVVDTMQNWPDTMQAAAPGFRDRIVVVYLPADEGGLNLKMSSRQIESLAARGRRAGEKVLTEFDFPAHRWSRFRIVMNGLTVALERIRLSFPRFSTAVPTPWIGAYKVPDVVEAHLRREAEQVVELAEAWRAEHHPATLRPPAPEPQLKFTPRM